MKNTYDVEANFEIIISDYEHSINYELIKHCYSGQLFDALFKTGNEHAITIGLGANYDSIVKKYDNFHQEYTDLCANLWPRATLGTINVSDIIDADTEEDTIILGDENRYKNIGEIFKNMIMMNWSRYSDIQKIYALCFIERNTKINNNMHDIIDEFDNHERITVNNLKKSAYFK